MKKKTKKVIRKMKNKKKTISKKQIKRKNTAKKVMKKKIFKKQVVKQHINKKMLIGEVAEKYPAVAGVLFEYGMHCIGCHINAYETIEQGCLAHGLTAKQIDEIVVKMNKIANRKNV